MIGSNDPPAANELEHPSNDCADVGIDSQQYGSLSEAQDGAQGQVHQVFAGLKTYTPDRPVAYVAPYKKCGGTRVE